VTYEDGHMLLGREFQTFGAHDEKRRAPITVHDGCSDKTLVGGSKRVDGL